MRHVLPFFIALLLYVPSVRAEEMVAIIDNGLMCHDAKALADLAGNDGRPKIKDLMNQADPRVREFQQSCISVSNGMRVTVITRRHNTSIVTDQNGTWFVPNIDFMTPGPDCVKDGTQLTMTGRIGTATGELPDERTLYTYPRLALDQPVCFIGNISEAAGRYVSLPTTTPTAAAAVKQMIGRHVTVTGMVGSPDNGNQPPDAMMMFDPVVRPAP